MRRVRTRQRSAVPRARVTTSVPGGTVAAPLVSSRLSQSRAYCGPGHGRRWPVEPGGGPADVVQVQTTTGVWSYRLLVHPRTHGPARDHQGRYPYLPVAPAPIRQPS
jgi:hypothetical protein